MNHAPNPNGDQHPAVARLRSELELAHRGVREIGELDAPLRERVVADLRTGLPDVASRAAHEVGADAAVAVISDFVTLDLAEPEPEPEVSRIWSDILGRATEAASASR